MTGEGGGRWRGCDCRRLTTTTMKSYLISSVGNLWHHLLVESDLYFLLLALSHDIRSVGCRLRLEKWQLVLLWPMEAFLFGPWVDLWRFCFLLLEVGSPFTMSLELCSVEHTVLNVDVTLLSQAASSFTTSVKTSHAFDTIFWSQYLLNTCKTSSTNRKICSVWNSDTYS